jgi:thioredoxin 1
MPALHIKKDEFEQKVLKADKPVLVDFFAHWCMPCKMAGPVIDQLADDYKDKALVAKVNVDEGQEIASQFGVMSIPTVIMFKDGKEINRQVGFIGKDGYEDMIKKAL